MPLRAWLLPLAFGVFGTVWGAWQAVLPDLAERFALSSGPLGVMLTAGFAVSLPAMLVSGRLLDRLGAGRVIALTAAVMALGLLVVGALVSVPALVLGVILFVLGSGTFDVAINGAAMADAGWSRPARVTLLHAAFSGGGVIGAVGAGAAVEPRVGLVPVLRAGLGMVDAMLELIPTAEVWHIGLYRDERTLKPVEYYNKLPDAATVQVCLILDPMLATGGSSAATVDILKAWGAARIKQVSLIAAPEGVATLSGAHPDVDIHVAALDDGLNERGYIVPGLGDAGDRQFGTFAGPASEPGHGPDDETAEVVRRLQRKLRE